MINRHGSREKDFFLIIVAETTDSGQREENRRR